MASAGEMTHDAHTCDESLARAFQFLGKRWNGVLLGTLMNGAAGFAELRRSIPGISDSVLSDRLSELAGAGLVQRTVREGPPVTVGYRLTPAGEALLPALEELMAWARRHLTEERCREARQDRRRKA
ncbi:winged helix-turn-helix transcriptional regulator [Microlunatus speluncae]|uniref:winged helix-turn-helix transcriptional regulator n=1 Tax=Microlunatus speluncae TaxID=2594267 RepID=UPI001266821A|nr:helix-turn-helix domain-containing protein [Microlunatus speluncae]